MNELIEQFLNTHPNWDFLIYKYSEKGLWTNDDGTAGGCHQLFGNYTTNNINTINFERYYESEEECINVIKNLQ